MKAIQQDMLPNVTLQQQSDTSRIIAECVSFFRKQKWLPAPFQRDFVWQPHQIKAWGKTIESNSSIGVIVTYQLTEGSPVFVLDGVQRLNATARYIENPSGYGFAYGPEQALEFCDAFSMPIQHRHYPTHEVAWEYFERLNRGTVLTPYELFKGVLAMSGPVAVRIANEAPRIVESLETPYIHASRPSRESGQVRNRDAYALFLRYATETTVLDGWQVRGNNLRPRDGGTPIEQAIVAEIQSRQWSIEDADRLLRGFRAFIAEQMAEIAALHKEAGGNGRPVNFTLWRWLLHLSIWRKNADRYVQPYQQLVRRIFERQLIELQMESTASRFVLPRTGQQVTLGIGGVNHLLTLCTAFEIPLYEGQARKRKKTTPGLHDSHYQPVALYGDGPTFPEPGLRNRSRGAKAV